MCDLVAFVVLRTSVRVLGFGVILETIWSVRSCELHHQQGVLRQGEASKECDVVALTVQLWDWDMRPAVSGRVGEDQKMECGSRIWCH